MCTAWTVIWACECIMRMQEDCDAKCGNHKPKMRKLRKKLALNGRSILVSMIEEMRVVVNMSVGGGMSNQQDRIEWERGR